VRFQWQNLRQTEGRFKAGPPEDVYALGVTAYRLVTGRYPPEVAVEKTARGYRVLPRGPVTFEPGAAVSPELAALLQRMLSEKPSVRGRAAEVAQALEALDRVPQPVAKQGAGRPSARGWAPGAVAAVSAALASLWVWTRPPAPPEEEEAGRAHARVYEERDAGTVGLADSVMDSPADDTLPGERSPRVGLDIPRQPFPGQRQPPCEKPLVSINGGCWVRTSDVLPPCGGNSYEWKKGCYVPMFPPPRPQTSQPR
jgi:eukaryotic-like serine/threonine-protein kinase